MTGISPDGLEADELLIRELAAAPSVPAGERNAALAAVMRAAARAGWTGDEVLALASELAVRWQVTSPERNLYQHWRLLLMHLRDVRQDFPVPGPKVPLQADVTPVAVVMEVAARDGWPNHDILVLASAVAVQWRVTSPGFSLHGHWRLLLRQLRDVRRRYPAPRP